MTLSDLFICLVAGLAVPMAILDAARTILDDELPMQVEGFQLERRSLPWMLGLFAGPALLFDRVARGWRMGELSRSSILQGIAIIAGWATIYGYVVLAMARLIWPE